MKEPEVDSVEYYEYVLNLHNLIIPKLKALRDSGNGTNIIHDSNQKLSVIYGWKSLYERDKRISSLVTWREYIRSAELWMEQIAKNNFKIERT